MTSSTELPSVLTMGDPAGVGAEIAGKAWLERQNSQLRPFYLLHDAAWLDRQYRRLGWTIPIIRIHTGAEAMRQFGTALPVLDTPLAHDARLGIADGRSAGAVVGSIDRAVDQVRAGEANSLVTLPINKELLAADGFAYPGHTDYLCHLGGVETVVMMLWSPDLAVVPVTVHQPLSEAVRDLTADRIIKAVQVTAAALSRDFGKTTPRFAIAGLNPHAGEGGLLGSEEATIIGPAIEILRSHGLACDGPLPADTMFHHHARQKYDVAICMYHDQALIPIKTLDFFGAVNVTLGLPFIRTSPDHGTAYAIAGTGTADPSSLIAAITLAHRMADNRSGKQVAA